MCIGFCPYPPMPANIKRSNETMDLSRQLTHPAGQPATHSVAKYSPTHSPTHPVNLFTISHTDIITKLWLEAILVVTL